MQIFYYISVIRIIPEGFKMPEAYNSNARNLCSIKLHLKHFGRMWYDCLSENIKKWVYKLKFQYALCVFTKTLESEFAIEGIYVDIMNLIGTPEEFLKLLNI